MTAGFYDALQSGQSALEITLQDSSVLKLLETVRVVPGKRFVCRGDWHDKPVYAKLFIGKDAKRYAMRDRRGVELLVQANLVTPSLLYAGATADDLTQVLIFQSVDAARNAEIVYQSTADMAERFDLASRLVRTVARHHNANLLQTDLYLKNFLMQDGFVFTLDGDGIRQYDKLSRQDALKNLAALLSKFDVIEIESGLSDLLRIYAGVRGWQQVPDAAAMKDLVNQHRRRATNAYAERKVFRACTDVQLIEQSGLRVAISIRFSGYHLPQTPQDCDRLIDLQARIKSGNTCTLALAQVDSLKLVIKRYNIKGFWHGVNRAMRQTRAARSWANAHRLMLLGIPTAAPVALIENRKFGLKGRAYFLSDYVDAPDAAEFFSGTADSTLQAKAVMNVVKLFYRLFLLQISHGDMKASNIKIVNGAPLLIDLDSMQQHRYVRPALKAHVRDLKRFMHNWQAMPALYNAFIVQFKVVYADNEVLRLARIIK